jgi:hypothetical protein
MNGFTGRDLSGGLLSGAIVTDRSTDAFAPAD